MAATNDDKPRVPTPDSANAMAESAELRQRLERMDLPTEVRERVLMEVVATRSHHSGPLPASGEFEAYGKTLPSAPDRILSMAERQQRHDHRIEIGTLVSETIYRLTGITIAGSLVGGMAYGSVICALAGQTAAAVALGLASGLTGLASVFVRGRNIIRMQSEPEPTAHSPSKIEGQPSAGPSSTDKQERR